jgi:hypothetical protein
VLTNAAPFPARIDKVEVLNAVTGRVVLVLTGAALRADLTPVAGQLGDEDSTDPAESSSRTVPSSATWVVWLDVTVAARTDVPRRLEHQVVGALLPPSGAAPLPFNSTVGSVPASTQIPPVLSPPVEGGIWYMSEGCCNDDTHHRRGLAPINGQLAVPQRFAIDFFRLDAEHRTWVGDPSKVTSYLSYRQPVIAAAPGTVVASRNDLPNSTALPHPPPIPPIDQTVGNFVIEQIAPGAYVLYAHLDPGSVQVHAGQKVSRGQLLGRIGTSGNSTTPHLHFQLLTTPTFFPTDSKPYVFDHFDLLGQITKRLWDDNLGLQPTGTLPFAAAAHPGPRTDELPLDRTVVDFPTTNLGAPLIPREPAMCQPAHLAGADNAGPLPGSDDCGKAATLRQVQGKPALTSCLAAGWHCMKLWPLLPGLGSPAGSGDDPVEDGAGLGSRVGAGGAVTSDDLAGAQAWHSGDLHSGRQGGGHG